jgi:hypothetical protein
MGQGIRGEIGLAHWTSPYGIRWCLLFSSGFLVDEIYLQLGWIVDS